MYPHCPSQTTKFQMSRDQSPKRGSKSESSSSESSCSLSDVNANEDWSGSFSETNDAHPRYQTKFSAISITSDLVGPSSKEEVRQVVKSSCQSVYLYVTHRFENPDERFAAITWDKYAMSYDQCIERFVHKIWKNRNWSVLKLVRQSCIFLPVLYPSPKAGHMFFTLACSAHANSSASLLNMRLKLLFALYDHGYGHQCVRSWKSVFRFMIRSEEATRFASPLHSLIHRASEVKRLLVGSDEIKLCKMDSIYGQCKNRVSTLFKDEHGLERERALATYLYLYDHELLLENAKDILPLLLFDVIKQRERGHLGFFSEAFEQFDRLISIFHKETPLIEADVEAARKWCNKHSKKIYLSPSFTTNVFRELDGLDIAIPLRACFERLVNPVHRSSALQNKSRTVEKQTVV